MSDTVAVTRYFTGKPCVRGHIAERTGSRVCVRCAYESNKAWRLANPATHRERVKAWREANPEKRRLAARRRNRRVRGAEGSHTVEDIAHIRKEQRGLCACGCGVSLDVSCTEDHVIPISRGGSDWASNIQLMTSWCNDQKGTKLMSEWKR